LLSPQRLKFTPAFFNVRNFCESFTLHSKLKIGATNHNVVKACKEPSAGLTYGWIARL